ncbi:MAG: DUF1801 domain-containing protein [Lapillicoccus sp.]
MGEVDDYIAGLGDPERAAFERVVAVVAEVAPRAQQGRSYGMPAFRQEGRPLLGLVAAQGHLSLFPFSPEVIEKVSGRLGGYSLSKGTIRFSADHPVPDDVLRDLVRLRLGELGD